MNLLGKRVIIFGDSQAQGLAPSLSRLLTAAGALAVGVSANPGVSLKTASETLQGATDGYDVVFVSFGGNNPPSTAARAFAYMQALLDPMHGKSIYWLTVLPAEDATLQVGRARMAAWQKRYLPSHGVTVLDGDALSAGLTRRDGLHLTSGGYARLADRIARKMTATSTPLWPWLVLGGLALGAGAYALTRNRSASALSGSRAFAPRKQKDLFRRSHWSNDPVTEVRDAPPSNRDSQDDKPNGFWYDCDDGWGDFLKGFNVVGGDQEPGIERLRRIRHRYEVLVDLSKMKVIRTAEQLKDFNREYKCPNDSSNMCIEWDRLKEKYDGIEICPFQREIWKDLHSKQPSPPQFRRGGTKYNKWRKTKPYWRWLEDYPEMSWYSDWDLASGCVWKKRAILGIREIPTGIHRGGLGV